MDNYKIFKVRIISNNIEVKERKKPIVVKF